MSKLDVNMRFIKLNESPPILVRIITLLILWHIDTFILTSPITSCPEKCVCHFHHTPAFTSLNISCIGKKLTSIPNLDAIDFKNATRVDLNLNANRIYHLFHMSLYPLLGKLTSLEILDNREPLSLNINVLKRFSQSLKVFKIGNWDVKLNDGLRALTTLVNLEILQISLPCDDKKQQSVNLVRVNLKKNNQSMFPFVKSLKLEGCAIENVAEDFLQDFSGLRTLSLLNNQLKSIPKAVYYSLILGLETLDLSFNDILTIEATDFPYLCKLRHLNLRNNRIYKISSGITLGKCPKLSEVILSENVQLAFVNSFILEGLTNVRLDLTNTSVQSLHEINTQQILELIIRGSIVECNCEKILFYFWKFGYRVRGSCLFENFLDIDLLVFLNKCLKKQTSEEGVKITDLKTEDVLELLDINIMKEEFEFHEEITDDVSIDEVPLEDEHGTINVSDVGEGLGSVGNVDGVITKDSTEVMADTVDVPNQKNSIPAGGIDHDQEKAEITDDQSHKDTETASDQTGSEDRDLSFSPSSSGNFRQLMLSVMSSVSRLGNIVGISNRSKQTTINEEDCTESDNVNEPAGINTQPSSNSNSESSESSFSIFKRLIGNGLVDKSTHNIRENEDLEQFHTTSSESQMVDKHTVYSHDECKFGNCEGISQQLVKFCIDSNKFDTKSILAQTSQLSKEMNNNYNPLSDSKLILEFDHLIKAQRSLCNDVSIKYEINKILAERTDLLFGEPKGIKIIPDSKNSEKFETGNLETDRDFDSLTTQRYESVAGYMDNLKESLPINPTVFINSDISSSKLDSHTILNRETRGHMSHRFEVPKIPDEVITAEKQESHTHARQHREYVIEEEESEENEEEQTLIFEDIKNANRQETQQPLQQLEEGVEESQQEQEQQQQQQHDHDESNIHVSITESGNTKQVDVSTTVYSLLYIDIEKQTEEKIDKNNGYRTVNENVDEKSDENAPSIRRENTWMHYEGENVRRDVDSDLIDDDDDDDENNDDDDEDNDDDDDDDTNDNIYEEIGIKPESDNAHHNDDKGDDDNDDGVKDVKSYNRDRLRAMVKRTIKVASLVVGLIYAVLIFATLDQLSTTAFVELCIAFEDFVLAERGTTHLKPQNVDIKEKDKMAVGQQHHCDGDKVI